MRSILSFITSCLILTVSAGCLAAPDGPFLSPLFSDNMVLQRGIPVPVWGWTEPGKRVTVQCAGKSTAAVADASGKWTAKLPPLPVGGPYTVSVSGPQNATLKNVLVGDVWVCSGQSNMEMGIAGVDNAEQEIATANYPQIRLFTVGKTIALSPKSSVAQRSAELVGQWSVCTPETIKTGGWGGFSAVAYFFGRHLHKTLKVPIGLIHTSWGGTVAEAWTSAEALDRHMPDYRPAVAQLAQMRADSSGAASSFDKRMAEWWEKNDPGSAGGLGWADPKYRTTGWTNMTLPVHWEEAGLSNFDGIVWFRHEFDLTPNYLDHELTLTLGPIDDRDTVWVNGVKVGETGDWQTARNYKIPARALRVGTNVIAVRVLDTGGGGGIYGTPEQMYVGLPGGGKIPLKGDWEYKVGAPLGRLAPAPMTLDNNPNYPTVLYNGMIAPLIPYAIKGAIWYQGESNAGKAYQYRALLPTLIADWRARWREGDFPFYIVQLASFMQTDNEPRDDAWPELREAQMMTAQNVKNSGIAVAIDIGDAVDIHPKNKQEVGRRLALAALGKTYGQKIEYSGPVYRAMRQDENAIVLTFDHLGGGLAAKGGGKLTGFAIAGADRKFVWADARIEGDKIAVSSPQVPNPVAVRYAWSNNPVANLVNKAGLPAPPFRTDDWPGITANSR